MNDVSMVSVAQLAHQSYISWDYGMNDAFVVSMPKGGGGTPMVGRFRGEDPLFGFPIRLGPYFIPQHNPIDPIFLHKKSVCLYHI